MKRSRSTAMAISTNGKVKSKEYVTMAVINELRHMTTNLVMSRAAIVERLNQTLGNHDVDKECGYPREISIEMYKEAYERDGIAERAVKAHSSESWAVEPYIFQTRKLKKVQQTPWEKKLNKLWKDTKLYAKLHQLDEVSGIGHYGALFCGFNDGRPPEKPVTGINEHGMSTEIKKSKDLLYVMPFDEGTAKIAKLQNDKQSRRYGHPLFYNITLNDPSAGSSGEMRGDGKETKVHWSRVIHVADNAKTSDVWGTPRLRPIFNRIIDIRKILGSSAEMFWKGGFPGIAFEVPPEVAAEAGGGLTDDQKKELKEEIEKYMNSIKRYLALVGVQAKQLTVNIADPDTHLEVQLLAICIALEVPMRKFMGTEEGKLAAGQDAESWNRRIHRRQNIHVTPNIIRPFADRLMAVGVLPRIEEYFTEWPDVYSVSKGDRAEIAKKLVDAVVGYSQNEKVKELIPPLHFLTLILDMDVDEAQETLDSAEKYVAEQVKKGWMMDPKDEVKMQKEERKAGVQAAKMKVAPGSQGFRGGQNIKRRPTAKR